MHNNNPCFRWLAALLLALPAVAGLSPQPVQAQVRASAAPLIDGLEVNADAALMPGSTLEFRLHGTPGGNARVQVAGSDMRVALQERSPGVYTGSYTVRSAERGLAPTSLIRSELSVGGRTSTAAFNFPPSFAAAQPPAMAAAPAPGIRVDRFLATPVERLAPGTELQFASDQPRAECSDRRQPGDPAGPHGPWCEGACQGRSGAAIRARATERGPGGGRTDGAGRRQRPFQPGFRLAAVRAGHPLRGADDGAARRAVHCRAAAGALPGLNTTRLTVAQCVRSRAAPPDGWCGKD